MLAYWDNRERCQFSNAAYKIWFGKNPAEMSAIKLPELLGAGLYEKNRPFILGALNGVEQCFERQLILPSGDVRESLATYVPDIVDGKVSGFAVHVCDVSLLKRRQNAFHSLLRETVKVLRETKRSFRSSELAQLRTRIESLIER